MQIAVKANIYQNGNYIISEKEDFCPSIIVSYLMRNFMINIDDVNILVSIITKNSEERFVFTKDLFFKEKNYLENIAKESFLN